MKVALWLLALFALAVAITLTARLDQGYVIIVFPPWRLELSFLLTLALLVGGFVLSTVLLHLLRTALRLPQDLRAWRAQRKADAANDALAAALQAYLDGDAASLASHLDKAEGCTQPQLLQRLQARVTRDAATLQDVP